MQVLLLRRGAAPRTFPARPLRWRRPKRPLAPLNFYNGLDCVRRTCPTNKETQEKSSGGHSLARALEPCGPGDVCERVGEEEEGAEEGEDEESDDDDGVSLG